MTLTNTPSGQAGRAADRVVQTIAQEILSGILPDGNALPPERELMLRFSASRTVIREAIATLGSRGLIEARPRFRPIVRKPGYDTALNAIGDVVTLLLTQKGGVWTLYQSRIFLERALVRDAARTATRADISALRDALAANEAAIGDSDAFYETDGAFHGVLYDIPRNPIFPAVHRAYTDWLAPHWTRMLRSPERNRVNYTAHKAIFDAIQDRDPESAEAELQTHLTSAWEYVRVTFDPA